MSIESRIDNVTNVDAAYRAEVLPAPKSLKIEVTSTCNLECGFCVKSLQKTEDGAMDRALYSRVIREAYDYGVRELGVFFIGESFTLKALPELIAEAKEVGFPYVFLTTNGVGATPERVRECMAAGLDSLKFSLNFYSAQQMASIAKVSPAFWRRAIENVKAAARVKEDGGYSCNIYASSIAFDGQQGEMMQAVIDEIKPHVTSHYFLPLYGMSGASKASGMQPQPGNPGRLANMREPLPCWSVFTEAHVTRDGLMAACCFGNGADGSLAMADLKEVSFADGWNSAAYQALRRAHLSKDVRGTACESCAAA